jgi:uncharacterized protein GlcG (DUF336 family)
MSPAINLAEAKQMIRRALQKGAEVGWISAYAVVDEGGNVIAMGRADGAPGTAMSLARAKALAAARTKAPTKSFAERMRSQPAMWQSYNTLFVGSMFPGFGGMPVVKDGKVVGGFACGGPGPTSESAGGDPGHDFWKEIDGELKNIEDVAICYGLDIPYAPQHNPP